MGYSTVPLQLLAQHAKADAKWYADQGADICTASWQDSESLSA